MVSLHQAEYSDHELMLNLNQKSMKNFLLVFWLSMVASFAIAQQRTVTGKITAKDDGTALPGVNVIVKGTTTGTVTDSNGQYSLGVPATGAVLVFSFIGLQSE